MSTTLFNKFCFVVLDNSYNWQAFKLKLFSLRFSHNNVTIINTYIYIYIKEYVIYYRKIVGVKKKI